MPSGRLGNAGLFYLCAAHAIFRFHHGPSFSEAVTGPGNGGLVGGPAGEVQRRQIEAFILAFPTNLAPIVGQQITLTASSSAAVASRVQLLRQRADAGDCELVAKTEILGVEAGFLYVGSGLFKGDRRAGPPITLTALQLLATSTGRPVTYTCVPLGSGERIGVDRNGDGFYAPSASTKQAPMTTHGDSGATPRASRNASPAPFTDGGDTIIGVSQLRKDDDRWNDDLKITYRRAR